MKTRLNQQLCCLSFQCTVFIQNWKNLCILAVDQLVQQWICDTSKVYICLCVLVYIKGIVLTVCFFLWHRCVCVCVYVHAQPRFIANSLIYLSLGTIEKLLKFLLLLANATPFTYDYK